MRFARTYSRQSSLPSLSQLPLAVALSLSPACIFSLARALSLCIADDMKLYEDQQTNRIHESRDLFQAICTSRGPPADTHHNHFDLAAYTRCTGHPSCWNV